MRQIVKIFGHWVETGSFFVRKYFTPIYTKQRILSSQWPDFEARLFNKVGIKKWVISMDMHMSIF